MRRPKAFAQAVAIATASWGVQGLMVWLCLSSQSLHLPVLAAFIVLMAVNVGVIAPAAPGSVGTFEFAAVVVLGFLGVDKTQALAFALVYHMVQLIPTVLAGFIALPLVGIRWRDLKGAPSSG